MPGPTSAYVVVGMTCAHCVRAVRDEVVALPTVREARVDLDSGRLEVDGSADREQVAAAVAAAGYRVEA